MLYFAVFSHKKSTFFLHYLQLYKGSYSINYTLIYSFLFKENSFKSNKSESHLMNTVYELTVYLYRENHFFFFCQMEDVFLITCRPMFKTCILASLYKMGQNKMFKQSNPIIHFDFRSESN